MMHVRRVIASALLALAAAAAADAQESGALEWAPEPLEEALARAARERRPALLYFRADWCKYSAAMEADTFGDRAVLDALVHYVCVRVDCTDRAAFLQARNAFRIPGVPTIILFSPFAERVDEVVGGVEPKLLSRKLYRAASAKAQTAAPTPRPGEWTETHRVFLRNGSVIDGQLSEFTTELVVVACDPDTVIQLKTPEVLRVELITLRAIGERGVEVQPVTPGPPEDEQQIPLAFRPGKPKAGIDPPPIRAAVRARIEAILAILPAPPEVSDQHRDDLRQFGEEGARYLMWRMQTLDDARTAWTVDTLARMTKLDIGPDVAQLFSSPRPDIRGGAARIAAARGERASIAPVRRLLRDESGVARTAAAAALAEMGDEGSLDRLADGALDRDVAACNQAVRSAFTLAKRFSGMERLLRRWMELVQRAPESGRTAIALILAEASPLLGDGDLKRDLRLCLETLTRSDRSALVRATAAIACGNMRSKSVVDALIERLAAETSPSVLAALCDGLGRSGDRSARVARALIEQLLARDADVRTAAGRVLRNLYFQNQLGADYRAWLDWYHRTMNR